MNERIDDGGPAFPQPMFEAIDGSGEKSSPWEYGYGGLSRRDWFAAHAPEPTQVQIEYQGELDRRANPHGDNYKPPRRSLEEVIADIKFKYADAMIAASKRIPR